MKKLPLGTRIKYNDLTGKVGEPSAEYDARTQGHRPPYEAYWFIIEPSGSGFWIKADDPAIGLLK